MANATVALPDAIFQLSFVDVRHDADAPRQQCIVALNLPFRINTKLPGGYEWDPVALQYARDHPEYKASFSVLRNTWDTPTARLSLEAAVCREKPGIQPSPDLGTTSGVQLSQPQAIGRDSTGSLVLNPYFQLRYCTWFVRDETHIALGPYQKQSNPFREVWTAKMKAKHKLEESRFRRFTRTAGGIVSWFGAAVAGIFAVDPGVAVSVWHRMNADYKQVELFEVGEPPLCPRETNGQCVERKPLQSEVYKLAFNALLTDLPGSSGSHCLVIFGHYIFPSAKDIYERKEAIEIMVNHAIFHDDKSKPRLETACQKDKSCQPFVVG